MKKTNKNSKVKWIRFILIFLLIIFVPMLIVNFLMDFGWFKTVGNGSDDGWLGFWGGYLGAIIAVGGVYWQVSREKEENIRAARPIFTLMYDNCFEQEINGSLRSYVSEEEFIGDLIDIYNDRNPLGRQSERGYLLLINNPSANPLLFVEMTFFYKNGRLQEIT